MSNELIKYAFAAGEISDTLYARSDLEKYDLGVALAYNMFVDYRGGISNRQGTRFIEFVQDDDKPTKFFPFKFAPDTANTYVVLFTDLKIRFIQEDGYVLEADKVVTAITKALPGVVTSAGHGYSAGDLISLHDILGMGAVNDRTFVVANPTTNTFELTSVWDDQIDTSGFGTFISGNVARIYTVASPYTAEDLDELRAHQIRDTVRLTHQGYKTRDLVRHGNTNWTLTTTDIGTAAAAPTGLTNTPSAAGAAGYVFVVTAVNEDGEESQPSDPIIERASVDYSTTAGSTTVAWDSVPGTRFYNVYRSNIITAGGTTVSRAMQVGYVGRAYGPQFHDTNIIPDFTRTPPENNNPFVDAGIDTIEVTAGGMTYDDTTVLTMTDAGGGAGWTGYAVIDNSSNEILDVVTTNRGHDYVTPVLAASVGSGATFTVTVGNAHGNNPAVASRFQQRQIYAATVNKPLTVWGSRPGQADNFDNSIVVSDADSYEFELDSEEVATIRHLVPTRGGLIVMTQNGIWQLQGTNGGPVTPTDVLSDPQSYTGISKVSPLKIDTDILYVEGKGTTCRLLSYNDFSKVYSGVDVSILSNHFFSPAKQIEQWSYASDPFHQVFAKRSDGALLSFTVMKEQNVFAWTQWWTRGLFEDVITVQEGVRDRTYFMISRFLGGRWVKCVERLALREFDRAEEAWFLDCALIVSPTFPAFDITVASNKGRGVLVRASGGLFKASDVGKTLRVGGGKMYVIAFGSPTSVTVDIVDPITEITPETEDELGNATPRPFVSGEWSLDAPFSEVSGAWHLEGEEVVGLLDGNVITGLTVTDGVCVFQNTDMLLPVSVTRAIIGLPYKSVLRTLPLTAQGGPIEYRRKRVVGLGLRVNESRGVKTGTTLENLYPMKERTDERPGEPIRLQTNAGYKAQEAKWSEGGQTFIVQDSPLPLTVLGLVVDTEVGDDPG